MDDKLWEKQVQQVLALAWCQFDKPLWQGRLEMEKYLREHFELKVSK